MLMYTSILLTIVIVIVNGSISSSTIERDVNEITRLHKEFLDRSPSIAAHKSYEIRCLAVNECCPNERENLYQLFTENQFNQKCLSNGTKLTRLSLSSPCILTIRQLIQITKEPMYEKYLQVLGNTTHRINRIKIWRKQMKTVCSQDELNSYYCQRNNMDKFKSCQRKVLQMIAKQNLTDNDTLYSQYISQWEQEYAIDNQKLAKAFTKL